MRSQRLVVGVSFAALFVLAAACGGSDATPGGSSGSSGSSGTSGSSGVTPAAPGITVGTPSGSMTTEKGGTVTFSVVLASEPKGDVTVGVSSSDTKEATVDKASLVFTSANWSQPQTVTVTGVNDDLADGDKDVTIALAKATSTDEAYAAIDPTDVTLKNADDDVVGILAMPPAVTKTTEKGGKAVIKVTLRSKPAADVTVPVVSSDVAEGTVDKATVTFTPANWNVAQDVTVTGIDDKVADPNKAYAVNFGKATSSDATYKDQTAKVDLTNTDDDEVVQLAAGYATTCARFVDGRLKCWGGGGGLYTLGYGDTVARGDNANEMGDNLPFVDLGTGRTAKFVTTGVYHTCAILDDDTLKCWGVNQEGQTGAGNTTAGTFVGDAANEMGDSLPVVDVGGQKVKQVALFFYHTCAILMDDTLKCWGQNNAGQLGYGDTTLRGTGANQMGASLLAINLGTNRKAKQVAVGESHTCAVLDNNTVKCWGNNDSGQLGYGDTATRGNAVNQMGDTLVAIDLGAGRTAKAVTAGYRHSCALLDNNTVKCWGNNQYGQLGQGDTATRGNAVNQMGDNLTAIAFGAGRTVKQLGGGYIENCALLDNDTVKCWGDGTNGGLGYGNTVSAGSAANQMGDNLAAVDFGAGFTVKSLAHGILLRGVLSTDSRVKMWGYGALGSLGYGDTQSRGNAANQMGTNLPAVLLVGP